MSQVNLTENWGQRAIFTTSGGGQNLPPQLACQMYQQFQTLDGATSISPLLSFLCLFPTLLLCAFGASSWLSFLFRFPVVLARIRTRAGGVGGEYPYH